MNKAIQDWALPLLIVLLGSGGLGALIISRLVPQRRSADEKMLDVEARINKLEALVNDQGGTINAQADYILLLRKDMTDQGLSPAPYPDNLKVR